MIFRHEHAKDISYVYMVNEIFESVSNLFAKQISKKDRRNTYGIVFVRISSCSVDKKIAHCCFCIDKI